MKTNKSYLKIVLSVLFAFILSGCTDMNTTNDEDLLSLQVETYVFAVIVLLVAFAFSVLVSQLIAWQPGTDRSYMKRRIWYIIIGILSSMGFWLYNQFVVMQTITGDDSVVLKHKFGVTNFECLSITIGGYVVLGLIVALVFRKSKFATIFFTNTKIR